MTRATFTIGHYYILHVSKNKNLNTGLHIPLYPTSTDLFFFETDIAILQQGDRCNFEYVIKFTIVIMRYCRSIFVFCSSGI